MHALLLCILLLGNNLVFGLWQRNFGKLGHLQRLDRSLHLSSSINYDSKLPVSLNLPWSLLSISGADRIKFLHGLTTADFVGRSTASNALLLGNFLNNKGKVVDHTLFLIDQEDIKILCETPNKQNLKVYIQSFIFPFDQVNLQDISREYSIQTQFSSHNLVNNVSNSNSNDLTFSHHQDGYYTLPITPFQPTPSSSPSSSSSTTIITNRKGNSTVSSWLDEYLTHGSIVLQTTPTAATGTSATSSSSAVAHTILYHLLRIYSGRPSYPYEIQSAALSSTSPSTTTSTTASSTTTGSNKITAILQATKKIVLQPRFSPFELGLADESIIDQKGCYTGQEIVNQALNTLTQPGGDDASSTVIIAKGSALRQLLEPLQAMPIAADGNNKHADVSLPLLPPGTILYDRHSDNSNLAECEELGIVTSNTAYLLYSLLFPDHSEVAITESEPKSISLLTLQENVLAYLQKEFDIDHHPLLQPLLADDQQLLRELLLTSLVMVRRMAIPAKMSVLDNDKSSIQYSLLHPDYPAVKFARKVCPQHHAEDDQIPQSSASAGPAIIPLSYLDYRFNKLLASRQLSQQQKKKAIQKQQEATASSTATAAASVTSEAEETVRKQQEIAKQEKLEKRKKEIEALIASKKKANNNIKS